MTEHTKRETSQADRVDRRTILQGSVAGAGFALLASTIVSSRPALAQEGTPSPSPIAEPSASPAATGQQYAYVGSDSRSAIANGVDPNEVGISVYAVDAESGVLSHVQTVPSDNAFYFAFHLTGPYLYAVNVISDYQGEASGSVEAYAIDPATGMLTFLNRQSSGGSTAAQPAVDPSGRFLVVANYNGANFTVLPINEDGTLEPVVSTVVQDGSGPNEVRQDMSHPHAVVFDPAGDFIAAADLGTDEVLIYRLDTQSGGLTEVSSVSTAPGSGPRHVAFDAEDTLLYVVNELDATISVFAYDAATGAIGEELQTISTVPDPFEGTKSTAEILIHPSGRFLYNSNRGQPDTTTPEGDAIVAFSIDQETGFLTLIGHTTGEISVPWSFDFDVSGQWLYAANYADNSITQFAIDQETGELTFTGERVEVPTPFVIQLSKP
jgi:6-phosphogluconolactonase